MKHPHLISGLILLSFVVGSLPAIGQSDSSQHDIQLEDVIITAQYAPTDSRSAIHEVKIIKEIDIKRQGFNNLAEVLTNQVNLRVSTDPVLGNGLRIQGIGGENVQIMIDGIPVIGRLNGNIDLSQILLQNISRIEIIEGALSSQYGSNASGGVINLITKKAQVNRVQLDNQNQYENIGIINNSLSLGIQLGKVYASLQASRYDFQSAPVDSLRLMKTDTLATGEQFRTRVHPWNPKRQLGLDGTLLYRFSDSSKLSYRYKFFDETLNIYGEVRLPSFRPYSFDDSYHTFRQDHQLSFDSYLGSRLYLTSTTGYNYYDRTNETIRLDLEQDTSRIITGSQDTSVFTTLLHRSIISTNTSDVINGQFGFELKHETGSGGRIIDSTSLPLNRAVLSNYAAWLSFKFQLDPKVLVQTNLRYGYNTKYRHPWIPSVNAKWSPNQQWTIRAGYARGFRAPSLKELHFNFIDINHFIIGNPELEAEYSHNATLSSTYKKVFQTNHSIQVKGKLFYNHISNRIILAQFDQLQFNYQNVAKYETNGLNLSVQYDWGRKLSVKSAFAFTRLYNIWSEESETASFVPLPEWQNELQWVIPGSQTRLVLTHRFIGKQIRFFTNAEGALEEGYIGHYHLLNASLSRDFWKKRIFISVGSKNLLNTQTVPLVGQAGGPHSSVGSSQLLNWGRSFFIRLNLTIGKQ
ncbi:MAG: TonB-dependent receptor [Bacteroidota bacterium]